MNITFQNKTTASGINHTADSWGAAWVDFNADLLPDLWINNHQKEGRLYLNQGKGKFTNQTLSVFATPEKGDSHASIWSDVDNDGDPDLLQAVDGPLSLQYYANQNGKLSLLPNTNGLNRRGALDRGLLTADFNQDGLLDITVLSAPNKTPFKSEIYKQQNNNTFVATGTSQGFVPTTFAGPSFGVLADLTNNQALDLLVTNLNPALNAYESQQSQFVDITSRLGSSIGLGDENQDGDVVAGDFNGDLRTDLLITKYNRRVSDVRKISKDEIRAKFHYRNSQHGFTFKTTSPVEIEILGKGRLAPSQYRAIPLNKIFIGSSGYHPSSHNFTLDPKNPQAVGIDSHAAGSDYGIYIGYQPRTQTWRILSSNPTRENQGLIVTKTNPSDRLNNLRAINFNRNALAVPLKLLTNMGNSFIDTSQSAGIKSILNSGVSAVAGDFDNDMDLDLYVLQTSPSANLPNLLLENDGTGSFTKVTNSGANGTQLGRGDTVTTVDYDLDGFLDLFLSNGNWPPLGLRPGQNATSIPSTASQGPYQLFQNSGNQNSWIQIDLVGTESNRDAIGSKVIVDVNGIKQVREQNGGFHNRSQNFDRLHFGLGSHQTISSLQVIWPTGQSQEFNDIDVNQIIQIRENSPTVKTLYSLNDSAENRDITGTRQKDRLIGSEFADLITGLAGDDILKGLAGNDTLIAGRDNDYLVGGAGSDQLTGNAGGDQFVYTNKNQGGDFIQDFNPLEDELLFKATAFDSQLEI